MMLRYLKDVREVLEMYGIPWGQAFRPVPQEFYQLGEVVRTSVAANNSLTSLAAAFCAI